MKNFRVHQNHQRLLATFKVAKSLPQEPEILSHYSRYLCVLCSGFLESSVRTIFADYAKNTAITTSEYVSAQLRRFQNPKAETIVQLVGAFDKAWVETFRAEISGEPTDSLNSIVENRNKIAHGESVGLSLVVLQRYFSSAIKIVELIDSKFHVPT